MTETAIIRTWQGQEFTVEWSADGWIDVTDPLLAQPDVAPIGEMEITPVRLDECWRCSVTIPKEDPLGLCDPCRIQLRNL